MAASTNSGRDFEIRNITVNSSSDTPVDFNSKYINSVVLRARTNVDLYVRRNNGDADYFTVPAGNSFVIDVAIRRSDKAFFIRSASGNVVVEVLGALD
jgi:hypothetical protein